MYKVQPYITVNYLTVPHLQTLHLSLPLPLSLSKKSLRTGLYFMCTKPLNSYDSYTTVQYRPIDFRVIFYPRLSTLQSLPELYLWIRLYLHLCPIQLPCLILIITMITPLFNPPRQTLRTPTLFSSIVLYSSISKVFKYFTSLFLNDHVFASFHTATLSQGSVVVFL